MEARSPEKLVNVSNVKMSVTEHDDQSKHLDYEIAIWDLSGRQRVGVSVCHPGTGAQCVFFCILRWVMNMYSLLENNSDLSMFFSCIFSSSIQSLSSPRV